MPHASFGHNLLQYEFSMFIVAYWQVSNVSAISWKVTF